MRRFRIAGLLAIAVAILPTGVFANDSIARFGAGGIELIKTDHIRMLEEVLEIAPHNVKVKYRFLNESDQDIETGVAFPFPSYLPFDLYESTGAPGTVQKTFRLLVDGKPVKTKPERKAVIRDRDITLELRKSGLSEKEIFYDVTEKDTRALFEKLDRFRRKFGDWWRINETAYWKMTFPAAKEIVVEHEYAPETGGGWASVYRGESDKDLKGDIANLWNSFTGKDDDNEDCLDEMTKRAIENRVKMAVSKGSESVTVSYNSVEYILGTARNWKGPIGEFTLRIKKEKPDEFVSLCFPGNPKKVSPTVYEFHEKNFVPPDKLVVYFYSVGPKVSQ